MQETVTINQINYNLEEILADCWHRLINGVVSAKHPFHNPSIATINNEFPEIRTVVLRKVIPAERILIFHTDYRSPKIQQIQKNNKVSWLFYDEKARIQIRLKTIATIHYQDDITLKRWEDSRLESRKCYLVNPAPSTFSASPTDGLPQNLTVKDLTIDNVAKGYENFVVVKNEVKEIDWLFLNHSGHNRAQFIYEEKSVKKYWVIP
jgi:pyridoxamine 5'-phosphate oxidase